MQMVVLQDPLVSGAYGASAVPSALLFVETTSGSGPGYAPEVSVISIIIHANDYRDIVYVTLYKMT